MYIMSNCESMGAQLSQAFEVRDATQKFAPLVDSLDKERALH